MIFIGQNEKSLCISCVHREFNWNKGFKCDEEKLHAFYENEMKKNITHENLCKKYTEVFRNDNFLCKDLIALEEFIYGTFKINFMTSKDGFCLDENNNFISHEFYFIYFVCEDTNCLLPYGGCLIVYDVDKFKETILDTTAIKTFDICIADLKQSNFSYINTTNILFSMNMRAYFDKDIWALKAEDGTTHTLLGDTPLIDLVYNKYLIPKIHIDRYYFEGEICNGE